MADWGFLGGLFEAMQTHSPLLGRLWLQIMLVFRMLILGTVGTDLFEDEQEQFECNTAQPGCKQVCYDQAFPISQYRFWVFHIVLISTPALLFLMYAVHLNAKTKTNQQGVAGADATTSSSSQGRRGGVSVNPQQDLKVMCLYMLNVGFRFLAEVAFLVGQWALYGFRVAAQYPCSRFPCPYTVDCFTSRPMEKTIFLCFYFGVGLLSALFSLAELVHVFIKWRTRRRGDEETDKGERRGEEQTLIQGGGRGGEEGGGGRGGEEGGGGERGGEEGGGGGEEVERGGFPRSGSKGVSVSRGGKKGHLYLGRGRGSGGSTSSRGSGRGKGSLGRSSSSSRIYSSSTELKSCRVSSQKIDALMV